MSIINDRTSHITRAQTLHTSFRVSYHPVIKSVFLPIILWYMKFVLRDVITRSRYTNGRFFFYYCYWYSHFVFFPRINLFEIIIVEFSYRSLSIIILNNGGRRHRGRNTHNMYTSRARATCDPFVPFFFFFFFVFSSLIHGDDRIRRRNGLLLCLRMRVKKKKKYKQVNSTTRRNSQRAGLNGLS